MSNKAGDMDAHRVPFVLRGLGTDETVAHTLGRTPVDGFILNRSGYANIYRGTTTWTGTDIYLRSTFAVNGFILLI